MLKRCIGFLGLLTLSGAALAQTVFVPVEAIRGMTLLEQSFAYHRNLTLFDAEFEFRAYNPALNHIHQEKFAVWLDKSRQTLSQLAISTTLYGQSYAVSPEFAQWWEGDTAVSKTNPEQPLGIDQPWMGPFGDTVVGSIMLDPRYSIRDLWNADTVRAVGVSQGVHSFAKRTPNGGRENVSIPYYEVVIQTNHYRITIWVGQEQRFLLYYKRERDGRTISDETWFPLNWR